jgi:hypothetical protein
METTKRIVILLVLALLTASPAQSAEKPAAAISNTRTASCLLKVTSDPAVFPVDYDTIYALMYSSGVGGKAAREVLDFPPDEISDMLNIEMLGPAGGMAPPPPPSRLGSSVSPSGLSGVRGRSTSRRAIGEYDEEMMDDERLKTTPGGSSASFPGAPYGRTSSSSRTGRSSRTSSATRRTIPAATPISATEQTFLFHLAVYPLPVYEPSHRSLAVKPF